MNRLTRLGIALLMINTTQAAHLTPSFEPKDSSFYVCYQTCRIKYSVDAPLSTYRTYQYVGCIITRKPCDTICLKPKPCVHKKQCPQNTHCSATTLKLFGWFNNYPQTLNAFYRCAYS